MRRGTTPTLQITVMGLSKIEIQNLYLTLEQQGVVIEKTEADVSIDSEVISATLTQEETLYLTAKDGCCHAAACIVHEQHGLCQQHRHGAGRGDTEGGGDSRWWSLKSNP